MIKGATNVGGIAGSIDYGATIDNCYNSGMVNATGFYAGGMVGSLFAGNVTNCYNIGTVPDTEAFYTQAIVGSTDKDAFIIKNCYYERDLSTVSDNNKGVMEKTAAEMKTTTFVTALNSEQTPALWVIDQKNLNSGFPLLNWQVSIGTGFYTARQDMNCKVYTIGQSVFVEFAESTTGQLTVTDLTGRTVANKTIASGASINIGYKGIYIVTVKINNRQYVNKIAVK